MAFNIFSSILFFLFIFYILYRIYNQFIYPVLQFLKKKNEHGYILIGAKEINDYEHRARVEKLIGRKLESGEEVHHINGKKWDNRKSNLALMTRDNHQKWHQRLSWMYENKMFPSIQTQKKKLIEDFSARLF